MRSLLSWGVFKRDGEFLSAYASRSQARAMSFAESYQDEAGRKAVVKRIFVKIHE